ncbi:glycerate kinase, partial [Staphylococcus hominis]|uniref:glycerate kinase n=1 Tax=Staphylococcus hominis TaxID=1290 RepID=UPI0037095236
MLTFFNPSLSNPIDILLKQTHFLKTIKHPHLLITPQPKIHLQTIYRKTPIPLPKPSKQFHLPLIAICAT